jgi:hypothetical protein
MDKKENGELERQLAIVEDFYSTRAVAHASFFVASVFGLFAILELMERRFSMTSLALLSLAYWIVWAFGLFSFLNFCRNALRANYAERMIASQAEGLINQQIRDATGQEKLVRGFDRLRSVKWITNHDKYLFLVVYSGVGVIAFIAFLLR